MPRVMTSCLPTPALLGLAAFLVVAPAYALSDRTFVSGKGNDANDCATADAPCRHFQAAHDKTNASGQINVLDSADYGPVRISKSIGIVNDGAGTASIGPAFNGVEIDVPFGVVYLRGLDIAASDTGVKATNVGSLSIVNCVVRTGFFGINIDSRSGHTFFSISRTIVQNVSQGVRVAATAPGSAAGVIDHVLAVNNDQNGLVLEGANVKATISDSVIANTSRFAGLFASAASVTLRNVASSHNGGSGFFFSGGTSRIAHSVATGNSSGIVMQDPAIVQSYGDNDLRGNGSPDTPVFGGSLTAVANQ